MLFIFDWDGTVLNSIDKIVLSLQEAVSACDLPSLAGEQAKSIIGLGLPEAINTLFPGLSVAKQQQLQQAYSEIYRQRDQEPCHFYPQAESTMHALKTAGHLLAVATGKSRRGLDRVLANVQMKDYFHATRTADETRSKPHPLMLQEILQELSVSVDDAIMIGDTEFDLAMANNMGMRSVGVSYGAHAVERLKTCEPELILNDLSGLLEFVSPQR